MVRGVLATMPAIAFALGATVYASGDQHGHVNEVHAQKPAEHSMPAPARATPTGGKPSTTTTTTKTGTTAKTTTTTPGTTLSPVQLKVQSHTQLANTLQSRLPAGTNVVSAASGFRNLGQFVAAVNVSHNLGIPFSQLKTDIVTNHMSLGQAIQALRPSVNATSQARRAEAEARRMIDTDTGDK